MRRLLSTIGFVGVALVLLGYLASMRWSSVSVYFANVEVSVGSGTLFFWGQLRDSDLEVYFTDFTPGEDRVEAFLWHALTPVWNRASVAHHVSYFNCPLWIPLIFFGLPTIWLWYADRRRPAPGACRCGYNLTGNTS